MGMQITTVEVVSDSYLLLYGWSLTAAKKNIPSKLYVVQKFYQNLIGKAIASSVIPNTQSSHQVAVITVPSSTRLLWILNAVLSIFPSFYSGSPAPVCPSHFSLCNQS